MSSEVQSQLERVGIVCVSLRKALAENTSVKSTAGVQQSGNATPNARNGIEKAARRSWSCDPGGVLSPDYSCLTGYTEVERILTDLWGVIRSNFRVADDLFGS